MSQSTNIRQGTIIRIVDDDEDIRDALSFMLECKGWQVRTYGSARDFLTQDSPSIPGCLLLDIRMPDMSGVQLQSLMKEQRIHLPIISSPATRMWKQPLPHSKLVLWTFCKNLSTRSRSLKPLSRPCASA